VQLVVNMNTNLLTGDGEMLVPYIADDILVCPVEGSYNSHDNVSLVRMHILAEETHSQYGLQLSTSFPSPPLPLPPHPSLSPSFPLPPLILPPLTLPSKSEIKGQSTHDCSSCTLDPLLFLSPLPVPPSSTCGLGFPDMPSDPHLEGQTLE